MSEQIKHELLAAAVRRLVTKIEAYTVALEGRDTSYRDDPETLDLISQLLQREMSLILRERFGKQAAPQTENAEAAPAA